ncbi:hypothetical protein J4Q44_G00243540 [Coregonus suidteri]|uniref:Uncharacterized protein n=1 Tax=Coregonus suidteri TaxID=861788 RepID=A0AAN8L2Q3_9TELE
MDFLTLRNIQGLHAPLKLQMEFRATRQVIFIHTLKWTTQACGSICLSHTLLHCHLIRADSALSLPTTGAFVNSLWLSTGPPIHKKCMHA